MYSSEGANRQIDPETIITGCTSKREAVECWIIEKSLIRVIRVTPLYRRHILCKAVAGFTVGVNIFKCFAAAPQTSRLRKNSRGGGGFREDTHICTRTWKATPVEQ